MPGKGQHPPSLQHGQRLRIRLKPAMEHRQALRLRAAATASPAAPAPTTSSAWARRSWLSSGARSGPAGNTLPLPMPRRPSTTRIERSLCSPGFWKPSSITIEPAPAARAASAPAARSRATMVGANRASSSGSSPTSAARCRAGSTRTGPGERAAIAAAEHERPASGRRPESAPPRSRSASCRRRPASDCRRRSRECRRRGPAAPSATPRPRHRRQRAATAGRTSGPPGATRTTAHALSALFAWPSRRSRRNCIR